MDEYIKLLYRQHIKRTKEQILSAQIHTKYKILLFSSSAEQHDIAFFNKFCPLHNIDNIYVIVDMQSAHISLAYDKQQITNTINISFHGNEIIKLNDIHTFFDSVNNEFNIHTLHTKYIIIQHVYITSNNLVYNTEIKKLIATMMHEKTKYEIYCICKANEYAIHAHKQIHKYFKAHKYLSEFQLYTKYIQHSYSKITNLPYEPIISINKSSCIIHNNQLSHEKTEARHLLIDAGTRFLGYCSDITNTYTKDSNVTQIIKGIKKIQTKIINYVAINIQHKNEINIHEYAITLITHLLYELNIINDVNISKEIQQKLYSLFTIHSIYHSIGLNVHDMHYACKSKEIKNDMALAIEPGVYFIQKILANIDDNIKKYINIHTLNKYIHTYCIGGVRLETNIIIYANKIFNLSLKSHRIQLMNVLTI